MEIYNINKGILNESYNNKLFHLSDKNLDGKIIQPRIPSNYFTKNGYEENKTPRICFAKTIDGSLMRIVNKKTNKKLYVHIPIGNYDVKYVNKSQVPDCEITNEVWITSKVKLKCIGIIEVIKDAGEDGIPFKYSNNTAELYRWEWKWLKKNIKESYISETVKYEKKYKCPYCNKRDTKQKLISHIERKHEEMIPENYTPARIVFNMINKKEHGNCIECGKETEWNEKVNRYERLCNNKKCHDNYVKKFKSRMKNKYGKEHLLNDPEHQEKMLANRSISGTYKFKDGGIRSYCGSYEHKLLEFFDKVLGVHSKNIISPGPVIEYAFKGKKHYWITDQYYILANLVFDVKDGGDNPNMREMSEYREKQIAKEKAIKDQGEYNYIRLTNNNFEQLLYILAEIKDQMLDPDNKPEKIIKINEEVGCLPRQHPLDSEGNSYITNNLMNNAFITTNNICDDHPYIVKRIDNGIFTDTLYTTDKYLSKLYKIKNNKIIKVNPKEELSESNYILFKYIGDNYKDKMNKISIEDNDIELYDDDYFYEILSNRKTLSPDQIIFDENFEETIDGYTEFEEKQSIIENTLKNQLKECIYENKIFVDLLDIEDIKKKNKLLKEFNNLNILQDIEGYYVINTINNTRTKYYNNIKDIKESTLKILSCMV